MAKQKYIDKEFNSLINCKSTASQSANESLMNVSKNGSILFIYDHFQ